MNEPSVAELLSRAFEVAKAADANEAIERVREVGAQRLLSYEIVLPEDGVRRHLLEEVLPRLIYFLDCRGAPLPEANGVVASVFHRDALYFLHIRDLLDWLCTASGLSMEALIAKGKPQPERTGELALSPGSSTSLSTK